MEAAEAPLKPPPPPPTKTTASKGQVEITEEMATANRALEQAMGTGQVEQLAAALLLHTAACPELLTEARALRNQLRHRSKKQRLKAKKAVASIEALQQYVDALVVAIGTAERVSVGANDKSELGRLLVAARARLERAREEKTAAEKVSASDSVALAVSHGTRAEEQVNMLDDVDDDTSCVVCLSEKKEICMFPCGHVCVCSSCSEAIFSHDERLCPVCRCMIEAKCKVYF